MAQLLVSPLICPVARFSAGGPRVCVRVVVGPTGHLSLRDSAGWGSSWNSADVSSLPRPWKGFHLIYRQRPCCQKQSKSWSLLKEQIRPVFQHLKPGPSIWNYSPLPVPTAPLMTMLQKEKKLLFPHCNVSPPFGDSPASSFSCWRWCTHLCDLQASASLVFRFIASLFRHCNALSHILITDFLLLRSLIHSGTFSHVKLDLEPWKIS